MPNRNGMTTAHGFGSTRGKPDVQGSACMSNCTSSVALVFELPTCAMNAHGNVAEQVRSIGPLEAVDTSRFDTSSTTAQSAAGSVRVSASAAPNVHDLMKKQACVACHADDKTVVGPSFDAVKLRYEKKADAETYLADRIRKGGVGAWRQVPMPAQQSLSESELRVVAEWILRRTN
jgi:cytochrome c